MRLRSQCSLSRLPRRSLKPSTARERHPSGSRRIQGSRPPRIQRRQARGRPVECGGRSARGWPAQRRRANDWYARLVGAMICVGELWYFSDPRARIAQYLAIPNQIKLRWMTGLYGCSRCDQQIGKSKTPTSSLRLFRDRRQAMAREMYRIKDPADTQLAREAVDVRSAPNLPRRPPAKNAQRTKRGVPHDRPISPKMRFATGGRPRTGPPSVAAMLGMCHTHRLLFVRFRL